MQEPRQKIDRVALRGQSEAFAGEEGNGVEELVRRDVGFEGAGIVEFAREEGEIEEQRRSGGWKRVEQEEVAEWRDVGEELQNDVDVVVVLDVVEVALGLAGAAVSTTMGQAHPPYA